MKYAILSAALEGCTHAYSTSGDVSTTYEAHEWRAPGSGDGKLTDLVSME